MGLTFVNPMIVAMLYGVAISTIEPFPYEHDLALFASGAAAFGFVFVVTREPCLKLGWMKYGLATFACFAVPFIWFWWGAMHGGLWYPPQPPILQQFIHVDGESAYDAMVSNLFLALWFVVTAAFAVGHSPFFRGRA